MARHSPGRLALSDLDNLNGSGSVILFFFAKSVRTPPYLIPTDQIRRSFSYLIRKEAVAKNMKALLSRTEKEKAVFRIEDSGAGVSPEDAPHIFDRFYKADKAHTRGQGTGLGLAICKRIMEKHGERIILADSNAGAAFEFTLARA